MSPTCDLSRLDSHLAGASLPAAHVEELGHHLQALIDAGLDALPYPGQGQTVDRWRALSVVASHDLGLVKLFEGHTDALATMNELGAPRFPAGSTWGLWASEPPQARVAVSFTGDGRAEVAGRKAWCSGAPVLSHALMTAWDREERQRLVAVELDQPEIHVTQSGWQAVGMGTTDSVDVVFKRAQVIPIGDVGVYVNRPGFWHGGAGIAACWYGAIAYLGEVLRLQCACRANSHRWAHLGAVDAALTRASAILRESAAWIDRHPHEVAFRHALRCRAVVEESVTDVIVHTGRALGAAPFCRDARFARTMADLPVFVRQSHAEADLESLGRDLVDTDFGGWRL